jgi:hypothetical protein
MLVTFPWAQPDQVLHDAAGTLRCVGWLKYSPSRVPAMWRRISELEAEPDAWLMALKAYGPLDRNFGEPVPEERARDPWKHAILGLSTVARLWAGNADIFELPSSHPIELTGAFRVLQANLNSLVADGSVRLVVRGLDLVPEPVTLAGFLWLAAAEAVREKHRFRRCERCQGWMRIQRTDARFCSATCRNKREEEEV